MVKSGVRDDVEERVVIIAVKASKEISKIALIWALTHVVQPGDYAKLLVVIPAQSSSQKLWKSHKINVQKEDIMESCSQMMLQLHNIYDSDKIKMRIKVVSGTPRVVAAEAKKTRTHWVVLDQNLNKEAKTCIEDLECNVVVINKSGPKVLRLNLVESPSKEAENTNSCIETPTNCFKENEIIWDPTKVPNVTPVGSPEHSSFTKTDGNKSSLSSLDIKFCPFLVADHDWDTKKPGFHPDSNTNSNVKSNSISNSNFNSNSSSDSISNSNPTYTPNSINSNSTNSNSTNSNSNSSSCFTFSSNSSNSNSNSNSNSGSDSNAKSNSISNFNSTHNSNSTNSGSCFNSNSNSNSSNSNSSSSSDRENTSSCTPITDALRVKFSELDTRLEKTPKNTKKTLPSTRHPPHKPPPLCSICQHKPPVIGTPPKWFNYTELEDATDGFSEANFLAEGGFGSVHRGVLKDDRMVAVKQLKMGSFQGDDEFYSEVEVLSCAQHRNIVMLIGYCVDDGRRLLVYEYVCNGSLDSHLYGQNHGQLEWSARQKIAIGAARGLRYLHEECRVGCIVHRDMRPNNILLTHDFEALVGDFGLARWQPDLDTGAETRIIGTFGYLAPEYAQSGEITEKADVYSFGVVLVELITGRKAVDITRPKGQQYLTEWARPLLKETAIAELIDPRLKDNYSEREVRCMSHCAWLCIGRDPHSRPRMSQVLWMLENNDIK